jgi:hypothetical protein
MIINLFIRSMYNTDIEYIEKSIQISNTDKNSVNI